MVQRVADGFRGRVATRRLRMLPFEPGPHSRHERAALPVVLGLSVLGILTADRSFDHVQLGGAGQRLARDRCAVQGEARDWRFPATARRRTAP